MERLVTGLALLKGIKEQCGLPSWTPRQELWQPPPQEILLQNFGVLLLGKSCTNLSTSMLYDLLTLRMYVLETLISSRSHILMATGHITYCNWLPRRVGTRV